MPVEMMPIEIRPVEKKDKVLTANQQNSESAWKEQLYIGGVFGFLRAVTVIPGMPVDNIKTSLHISPKGTTIKSVFNDILNADGLMGFYKGTGWAGSRLFAKEALKGLGITNGAKYVNDRLDSEFLKKNSQAGYMIAAPFIAVPEVMIGVLDRIRIAAVTNGCKGAGAAFIKGAYNNGGVAGVFKAAFRGGSINYIDKSLGTVFYHAMIQEATRAINKYKNKNEDENLSAVDNFGVSLFTGIVSAMIFNPLHVVRTQVMQHNSPFKAGVGDALKHVCKNRLAFSELCCMNRILGEFLQFCQIRPLCVR